MSKVAVSENRAARKYTAKQQIARILWALIHPLFAFSPRPLWGWRRQLLRLFGAHVGQGAHIYPSAKITMPWNLSVGEEAAIGDGVKLYALGKITVGERTTISQWTHICAGSHNVTLPSRPLTMPPIVIGSDCWIATDAFVGPGVSICDGTIVGARSVVIKDIREKCLVAGNPAKKIREI